MFAVMKRLLLFMLSKMIIPIKTQFRFFIFMYLLGAICIISDQKIERCSAFWQLFFDVYALSLVFFLIPKWLSIWLKPLLCCILYFLAIVDIFCISRLGCGISPMLVQVFLQTNKQEASEALHSYLSIDFISPCLILVFILIVLHLVCCYNNTLSIDRILNNNKKVIMNTVNTVVCILLLIGAAHSYRPHKFIAIFLLGDEKTMWDLGGKPNYRQGLVYYIPVLKLVNSLKLNTFGKQRIVKLKNCIETATVDSCSFISPNIVLIIGESHNKHHSQLYGYDKPVSPIQMKYKESGNLVPFSDVVTSYNITTDSFQNMFSLYEYGEQGSWYNYTLFPVLFKRSGYHTVFITNQFTQSYDANMWDFAVGNFLNDTSISEALFDSRNNKRHIFDECLLHDYDSLKQYNTNHNLIIFHLLGLHASYRERSPMERRVFSSRDYGRSDLDENQKVVLADYDNAALYNDYVLSEIIKRFLNEDAIIVYLPDHGEECFDGGGKTFGRPHKYEPVNLYQQFQIPFWVFMTDVYKKNHPILAKEIDKVKDYPIMTDILPHFLIHLGGISTPYYQSKYDFLSKEYDKKRKRMIMGTHDYDKIMSAFSN